MTLAASIPPGTQRRVSTQRPAAQLYTKQSTAPSLPAIPSTVADLPLTSSANNRTSTEPLPLTTALGSVLRRNRLASNRGIPAAVLNTVQRT